MLTLNQITRTTAIALAATSGAIATYGLCKIIPGSEPVVIGLGVLFEAAKLVSLANLHRHDLPRTLKAGLGGVAVVLMTANVAGVSGLLSSSYQQRQLDAQAQTHHAARVNDTTVNDLKRQIDAADTQIKAANDSVLKAREDKDRARAARDALKAAKVDRDALAARYTAATQDQAQGEATAIAGGGEFGAVHFLADVAGVSADTAAKIVITTLAAVPDISAALLLLASSYGGRAPLPQKTVEVMERRARERQTRKQAPPPAAAKPAKKPEPKKPVKGLKNVTVH
jgi:hypothetical protein